MDNPIVWAAILFAAAFLLFAMELFVPSGGLLGVLSALSAMGGVVALFFIGPMTGLVGAIVVLGLIPVLFVLGLKIWPTTPVGRALMLSESQTAITRAAHSELAGTPAEDDPLMGRKGIALTDLRPIGACLIDGQRIECLAERGMIARGTEVVVVDVDGMEIRVEPCDEA